jgi:endonuclease YncB( thermonuclease family)
VGVRPVASDNYGRTIAEVFVKGVNINLRMVQSGNAFVYTSYMKGCDKGSYHNAENIAEKGHLGVWSSTKGIIRPWDWRHKPSGKSQPSCHSLTGLKAKELYSKGHIYLDKNNDGIPCNGND